MSNKNKINELIGNFQGNDLPQVSSKHKHTFSHTYIVTVVLLVVTVLLLNKVGYLPWDIWSILLRFWPVFLIMLGLHAIAGKSVVINLLVTAIGIGLTASIVGYAAASVNPQFNMWLAQFDPQLATISNQLPTNPGPKQMKEISITKDDYPNTKLKDLNMQVEAGIFDISDSDSNNLFNIKAEYYKEYGMPVVTQSYNNDNLVITLSTEHAVQKSLAISENLKYSVDLGQPKIPVSLTADVIAGTLNAKFTKTKISNLDLTTTAGTLTISLDTPSVPTGNFSLNVGAGTLTLKLPYNTFAKINYSSEVGIIKVDNQLLKGSGNYTTPNFHITTEPMVINAHVGAGTIIIDTSGNL